MTTRSLPAALAVLMCLASAGTVRAEKRPPVQIPEFSRRQVPEPYCILEVTLKELDETRRKAQILNFLKQHDHNSDLGRKYAPFGVDYSNFAEFSVIIFDSCSRVDQTAIDDILQKCDGCLAPNNAETKLGISSKFIGEPNVTTAQPRVLVERYMGRDRLNACSIKIPVAKTENETEPLLINGDIRKLQMKYMLPLMLTLWQNDDIYLILSRSCDQAPKIYGLVRDLLGAEAPDSARPLQAPEFSPDVTGLWQSIGGDTAVPE